MKTIVVGIDTSPAAAAGASLARKLLGQSGRVVLLRTVASGGEADATLHLARIASRVAVHRPGTSIWVETLVRHGDPLDVLLHASATEHADMVVLGAHSGSEDPLSFSSIVAAFALQGPCPTLLTHHLDPDTPSIERVVLASDGSEAARGAAACAFELASSLGVPLEAVSPMETTGVGATESSRRHQLESVLRDLGAREPAGRIVGGRPRTAVAELLTTRDLVVAPAGFALGLVRIAPCGVVVARTTVRARIP